MRASLLLCFTLTTFLCDNTFAAPDKVVCYFRSWSCYRNFKDKFCVENIDPKLCTHLIYSFVGLAADGSVKVLDAWNDLEDNGGLGGFKKFVGLKKKAPKLKTLVAIGCRNADGSVFSKVVASKSLRGKFVKNVVAFLKKYKFDGFDLDWEYPAAPDKGGNPADVKNFSKLIKELRAAFKSGGYLLTAAVAASESALTKYYEVKELSKYLDFMNVMTYDLHGHWDGVTGLNAPLNPGKGDTSGMNVKSCIDAWIKHGANPKKLVLGMGAYGRTFTLNDPNNNGIGASTTGPGKAGLYTGEAGNAGPNTGEAGTLGYNEIVEMIKNQQLTVGWSDTHKCPYGYNGDQWVGYDDPKSIQLKCAFAKKKKLGGCMVWSIDTDDFLGVSGTKFQLLKNINSCLGRKVPLTWIKAL